MKKKYNQISCKINELKPIYKETAEIFNKLFKYYPREDSEKLLTELWDKKSPKTNLEYIEFYYDNILMAEESCHWYQKSNNRRIRRAIVAASIAKDFKCKTFAEYGCGPCADAKTISKLGLKPIWLGDINEQSLKIGKKLFKTKVNIINLIKNEPGEQKKADLLFSSDAMEHIFNLEKTLYPWITKYKVVIVYAPFASNKEQHQHTDYNAYRYHNFMKKIGYEKIVYNLAIPPFVYIKK